MICRTCGRDSYHIITRYTDGRLEDTCNQCGNHQMAPVYDCYFDKPGTHYNIYDEKGNAVFIGSKGEKSYWMKRMKVREAGDRIHGASSYDPTYARVAQRNFREQLEKGA